MCWNQETRLPENFFELVVSQKILKFWGLLILYYTAGTCLNVVQWIMVSSHYYFWQFSFSFEISILVHSQKILQILTLPTKTLFTPLHWQFMDGRLIQSYKHNPPGCGVNHTRILNCFIFFQKLCCVIQEIFIFVIRLRKKGIDCKTQLGCWTFWSDEKEKFTELFQKWFYP